MYINPGAMGTFSLLLLPILLIHYTNGASVISVDLGSEWMKVGIVSPGVPMEVVLNKESKRKTPAVVAFRDGVRTFGEDAVTVGVRFPKNSYKYILDLLGKPYNHPVVQAYIERFPYYEIVESERGTPEFVHDESTRFTPEELVAQMLAKAKEFAEISHADRGQQITDAVITVPGYFTQAERQALRDAATLAGLHVLQLINDYTAVAINYGIFRRKEINETAWHALFFDMGATSTKAALVEFRQVKGRERGAEPTPQLQVLGVGFDRTLGGLEITLRLREHLIRGWLAGGGGDPRASPRAMEKLLREAERLKVVLSANTEFYAQIESLLDDRDFKLLVTRAELESLCADVWPRVGAVAARAAAAAGGAGAGARLVLAGGGARAPAVLAALTAAVGHEPSRSINADEAACMGAVYRAASLATGYKVAPLTVRDAVLLPVQVVFTRHVDGVDKMVKRTLFGAMNPYPQKKVITFNKHSQDFAFNVRYADLDHLPAAEVERVGCTDLATVSLTGVAAAIDKHPGENVDHKGIKAHFHMDDSGILNLVNVEFVAEKTVTEDDDDSTLSKLGSTISKLFGADEPEKAEETNKTETKNDTVTEKANATEAEVKKPKIVTVKEPITAEEDVLSLKPLSKEQFKASKAKINELDSVERKRTERETALNNLEAFVVDAQMKMDMEEYSECGTPEQIAEIKKYCSEVSAWLYDDGYDAPTETYDNKLMELKKLANSVFYKHWEHGERPEAVAAMRSLINSSQVFLKASKNFTKDNEEKDIFTDVELEVLEKKITETVVWLDKAEKKQNKLKKSDEITLTVESLREKMAALDREVKYLINKMKIWRPKKPIKKETDNKTEEAVIEEKPETAEESESGKPEVTEEAEPEVTETPATEATEPPLQLGDGKEDDHSEL